MLLLDCVQFKGRDHHGIPPDIVLLSATHHILYKIWVNRSIVCPFWGCSQYKWHEMWEMSGCVAGREEMLKKFQQVWLACCWSYDRYWSAVSLTSNSTFYLWSFKIWSMPKSPSLSHALLQRLGHTSQLSAPHMCQRAPASRSSTCLSFGLSHYFLAHHGWLLIL